MIKDKKQYITQKKTEWREWEGENSNILDFYPFDY